jgi:hypothetical protein
MLDIIRSARHIISITAQKCCYRVFLERVSVLLRTCCCRPTGNIYCDAVCVILLLSPLLGRHAPDVVVKSECRRQEWLARPVGRGHRGRRVNRVGRRRRRTRAVHSHVEATRVVLVSHNLDVLESFAN